MAYLVIVLAVLARFIPHMYDFSPVYGAVLFGSANMKKRDSVWFPVLLLGISDFLLTKIFFHRRFGWYELFQLAAFASIALIGWTLRKRVTLGRLGFACLAAPTAFYLISDFGVWIGFGTYPLTWNGLVACYVAAIPFQGRIFTSTALFSGILFGAQQLYAARVAKRKQVQAMARSL
ncbi:MAG TPA: DUF6580 family putative transport protein [Candidatus Sulfotelmatobacter sp.]|nr:DUF6580 family putative transport protein [Candidatus Sulfotelmatobacter sp.]